MWVISVLFCRLCMSLCSYVLVVSGVCVSPLRQRWFSFPNTHTHTHTIRATCPSFYAHLCSFFAFDLRSLFIAEDFNVHQLSALRTQLSFVTAR
jgi:hypothetical protein